MGPFGRNAPRGAFGAGAGGSLSGAMIGVVYLDFVMGLGAAWSAPSLDDFRECFRVVLLWRRVVICLDSVVNSPR